MTREQLKAIARAQLLHTKELIETDTGMSDDHFDYLQAALSLSHQLNEMDYTGDVEAFQGLLDTGLDEFASDGICQAIYDLKPKSLED